MSTEKPGPENLPLNPEESLRPPPEHSFSATLGKMFDASSSVSVTQLVEPKESSGSSTGAPSGEPSGSGAGYILRKVIAFGGHGEVWDAVQVSLNRKVAIKRIRAAHYADSEPETIQFLEMSFHKEALVTGRLDHPTIVPVYDLGQDQRGKPLMAMKLVEGKAWNEMLFNDRTLDEPTVIAKHLPTLVSVAQAVSFAHSRGIIHRDLKPSQVMVGTFGEVFLMDWGLAVVFDERLTTATSPTMPYAPSVAECYSPAGTVCYMAPEQTEKSGARLGPWTDVFLLGGILYFILTNTYPHPQDNTTDAFIHAQQDQVEPPEERAPAKYIPRELSAICMRALSREIGDRFTSVDEFVHALEQYRTGASRKAESAQLTQEAREKIAAGETYRNFAVADSTLARAISLHPENIQPKALQQDVISRFSRAAIGNRDYGLARVLSVRVEDAAIRAGLERQINSGEALQRRHRTQRIAAIAASFLLVLGLGALGLLNMRIQANAKVEKLRAAEEAIVAKHRRDTAAAQQAHEEKQRKLFEAAKDLRAREAALALQVANELKDEYPLPATLKLTSYDLEQWKARNPATIKAIRTEWNALKQRRAELIANNLPLEKQPRALLLGMATLLLKEAHDSSTMQAAYVTYADSASATPKNARDLAGMAIVAFNNGNFTSATQHLSEAAAAARRATGLRGDFQKLMTLRAELERTEAENQKLSPDDIVIEPTQKGKNSDRFAEISGPWMTSSSPADWAKSMAPGVSNYWDCGTRIVRFLTSSEGMHSALPAVARYYPRLPEKHRRHVYVTWPVAANASPVTYRVRHAAGETTVSLMQDGWRGRTTGNANKWVELGEYEFLPGDEQYVELTIDRNVAPVDSDWNGQVQADAMLFAVAARKDAAAPDRPESLTPLIAWQEDFETAKTAAKAQGKPIFLFFFCPSHPYSNYWHQELLSNESVAREIMQKYIPARIHPHGAVSTPLRFQDEAVGSYSICNAAGEVLQNHPADRMISLDDLRQSLSRNAAAAAGGNHGQ